MKVQTRLRKSGNAHVIPVPAAALHELGVQLGTELTMTVSRGKIELERAIKYPSRDEILAALATAEPSIPDDIRDFVEAPPAGREII